MKRVVDYWRIPDDYVRDLGGVHWELEAEALCRTADGTTLAFADEVRLFLEGFLLHRPVIHFGCVILLLDALRQSARPEGPSDCRRLGLASHRTARGYRNAGAFCAILSDGVPSVPDPPAAEHLWQQMEVQIWRVLWPGSTRRGEVPPLSPAEFRAVIGRALARYTDDEIDHWLQHGSGPLKTGGEEVARELLAAKPPSLESILAELIQRPRLAGAVPFVPQITGALCLPPRRLEPNELPQGGYTDVTTRGQFEQLLPGQFALDDLEFLRRFAEKELLYFRREEPQAPVREELIVLLDLGVRTWGPVRLLLAATLFALGKSAAGRKVAFRIATTGVRGTPHDPLTEDREALAGMLEASDLSANPGLALERVLEEPAACLRDVVLLTQPRNLAEFDVTAAARRALPPTRLFAVAADEHGAVEVSEVKHGVPVRLSRFRVDMTPAGPPMPAPHPARDRRSETSQPWKGHVEPVPYPFRFGTDPKRILFNYDFDESGDWLLNASHDGTLHAIRTDGSGFEVLPRAMVEGHVLNVVHAVQGVSGGFVVGAVVRGLVVAAHYDMGSRTCNVHPLGLADPSRPWGWVYFRDLHSVVAHNIVGHESESRTYYALNLASDCDTPPMLCSREPTSLAIQAIERAKKCLWPNTFFKRDREQGDPGAANWIHLNRDTGTVSLGGGGKVMRRFTPLADGKAFLIGCKLLSAGFQEGSILVFFAGQPWPHDTTGRLMLFRLPEGIPIGDYRQPKQYRGYALSRNGGRWAALQDREGRLLLRDTAPGSGARHPLPTGEYPEGVQVELGDYWLAVGSERRKFVFRWDRGRFQVYQGVDQGSFNRIALRAAGLATYGQRATPGRESSPDLDPRVRYLNGINDGLRFVAWAENTLIAGLDRFGEVALFGWEGRLRCMFFVLNRKFAVWMPDGTCFGSAHLLGRSPTPGAPEAIGRALFEATERSKEALPDRGQDP
jgi:hypothetical protein